MKKLSREEEKKILEQCLRHHRGDRLVEWYWHMVLQAVKKTFHRYHVPFGPQEAEDLRNDVFVRLFEKEFDLLRRYDPERGLSLTNWIKMIAAQTVITYLRKKDRFGRMGENDVSYLSEELFPEDEDPGSDSHGKTEKQERLLLVRLCAEARLSHQERLVFMMHFFDEVSLPDIASFLHKTENNIYQIKHRGTKKVTECVEKKENDIR